MTPDAVALVKRFEGLRLRAVALEDGGFVVGHGHVSAADPGRAITADEAHALLLFDLSKLATAIEPLVLAPTTPAQFDALLSFAFGVGLEGFEGSVVLQRLNAGAYLDAAAAIELWRCARIGGEMQVVDVLVRRRAVEKARFLEPPEGFAPAPSATLRPQVDARVLEVAEAAAPDRRPVYGSLGGETAPSAALAVVAALSTRLDLLMREPPEPEAEPPPLADEAPPAPVAPAPPPLALVEPEPETKSDPTPVFPEPPAAELPAVEITSPEPLPVQPKRWEPEVRTEPRVSPPSLRGPAFVLGVFGLLLFALAVLKTYQAPSLLWLALGLLAVAAMVPASLFLIGPRRRDDD